MCRYGFHNYKEHYACFRCRKTFKRQLKEDVDPSGSDHPARCPDCGLLMAAMGLDFAAPRRSATKQWAVLESLWDVGVTFHSCGCGGPGYRPRATRDYEAFLRKTLAEYLQTLRYWIDGAPAAARGAERRCDRELAESHRTRRGRLGLVARGSRSPAAKPVTGTRRTSSIVFTGEPARQRRGTARSHRLRRVWPEQDGDRRPRERSSYHWAASSISARATRRTSTTYFFLRPSLDSTQLSASSALTAFARPALSASMRRLISVAHALLRSSSDFFTGSA
jgi:hypothetical protein